MLLTISSCKCQHEMAVDIMKERFHEASLNKNECVYIKYTMEPSKGIYCLKRVPQ